MTVQDAILGSRRIAIDTSPVIDFVANDPVRGPIVEAVFTAIDDGRLFGLTSVLTLTEALVRPKAAGNIVVEQ